MVCETMYKDAHIEFDPAGNVVDGQVITADRISDVDSEINNIVKVVRGITSIYFQVRSWSPYLIKWAVYVIIGGQVDEKMTRLRIYRDDGEYQIGKWEGEEPTFEERELLDSCI